MNASVANLRWKTTVCGSVASTLSTIRKLLWRGLTTPSGGKMILFHDAATSSAASGVPSWNLTPVRILKVQVVLLSVGVGISVHRSHTMSGEAGSIGLARISVE